MGSQICGMTPSLNCFACLFGDLKLHSITCFALDDLRPASYLCPHAEIRHTQAQQITTAKFAIYCQIKQRQISFVICEL